MVVELGLFVRVGVRVEVPVLVGVFVALVDDVILEVTLLDRDTRALDDIEGDDVLLFVNRELAELVVVLRDESDDREVGVNVVELDEVFDSRGDRVDVALPVDVLLLVVVAVEVREFVVLLVPVALAVDVLVDVEESVS